MIIHYFIFVVIISVSIKINLPRLSSTTLIIIRIYDGFWYYSGRILLVLEVRSSNRQRIFFWFSCSDLLISSLNDFVLRPLLHLGIRQLPISISFNFKMSVNIIQYRGTVGIYSYRIFVRESNINKLSLTLQ